MREIFAQKKYGWHKKVGTRKLKRMVGLAVFFFFPRLIFIFWRPKTNPMRMVERRSKKMRKSPYFEEKEVKSRHI
jgi:hypothetical protein